MGPGFASWCLLLLCGLERSHVATVDLSFLVSKMGIVDFLPYRMAVRTK